MAITMSDEELVRAVREMADRGELVTTGWTGFRVMVASSAGGRLTPEQENLIHWAFWAGARCVFDALERLDAFHPSERRTIERLKAELGGDPFCRPPKSHTDA